ncbi:MAG TPA: tetratricopeptide repeat protein, partial [Ignavibacteriales bacterium]|nr:tetratricopeptide repeat protein [Ignavibacteriales bacterium]
MEFSYQNKIFLAIALFILIFIPSCGVWDNFTTYFNLYYNANELFEKAEKQIKAQKKELFSINPPNITGSVKSDLIKVIEKCSNLLQFNSQSSYVDDALMMLGKSFYYQRNYQKAIRKFRELITNYPESDDLLEANLWVGKCQMRLKKYDAGLRTLASVRAKAVDEGEDEIIRQSYIEEIVYKITIDDIKGAIEVANEFMDVSDDDEIKAEVWFEIGKLNMQVGNVESAIKAFKTVFDYSPGFDLEFDAKLNYGKALREGERSKDALNVFENMKSEDKYSDKYGDIDFEIAKTNRKLGDIGEAINLFNEVDTLYRSLPVSGASKYEIGSIYETDLINLDSAATYYSKAATSTLPKEYIELARDKNRLFTRYVKLNKTIEKYNKQLFYVENPDVFAKDSVAYVEDSLAIAEEIANIQELQAIWSGLDSLLNQQDTTGYYVDTLKSIDSLITQ